MRTKPFSRFLIGLAAVLIACGKGVSTPTGVLQSLSVSGPTTVAPGATAAFTATGHLNNGTTEDYTTRVTWQSQDNTVISFQSPGQGTGGHAGETMIAAVFSASITAKQAVLVLPRGTFRLTGLVTASGVPVSGATVTVTAGVGQGLSTLTGADGQYRLYGVSGNVGVRVTKAGYWAEDEDLTVTQSSVADFALTPAGAPPNLSGTYSMVITASSACPLAGPWALPSDLRTRHYGATIVQNGLELQVTLSGSNFVVQNGHGNSFAARIDPTQITFQLGDGYYYSAYPDLLESVGGGRALLIDGNGTLVPTATGLAGHLDGNMDLGNLPLFGDNWYVAGCDYLNHDIALTRQQASPARIRR